ncbi:MAG: hypothetical protein EBT36_09545 [Betaproteobacteria bacterium]|jgi:uncharacterized protein|nr:DUF177 domain-containing protein [Pseudomonadota bacterium]NBO04136.1 hypothetical protein [Betaproteobacteria bacterium]HAB47822.1 hypothetical protein [Lautropia sp.]NBO94700.1 hypothetical protein [Betaproteobacteria bacterium]NBP36084.1 hypothetical protein [Betaproteobacteria bacterium]
MRFQANEWTARSLPLMTWIEHGGVFDARIEAEVLVQEMPRLYALSQSSPRESLRWRASGLSDLALSERRYWLRLEASAQLMLVCQRCMHPLSLDLQVKRRFLVARNEAMASKLEDAAQDDYDVIAHDKHFDLLALVEDELLLALPIVPKHLQCEPPGTSQAVAPLQSNRPKPFAVLSSLKSITDDDKRSED